MIIYKKASRNDFDGIYAFCQKLIAEAVQMSFVDVTSPEVLESWFEKSEYDMYIGVLEEAPHKVVGMLRTKVGTGDQSHSIYLSCAVDPEYRNHSIATAVTDFGLADQKEQGILIARTLIFDWNTPSIKTIEKCGFTCSGRVVMVIIDPITGKPVDDLIYYKVL